MIDPPPLAAHCRDRVLAPEERPLDVHRVHEAPAVEVGRFDVIDMDHTGVVHDDIEATEAISNGGDERTPLVLVTDVVVNEHRLTADLPSGVLALSVHVGQHHPATLAGEHDGVGLAQPIRRARDDAHLAVDPSHHQPSINSNVSPVQHASDPPCAGTRQDLAEAVGGHAIGEPPQPQRGDRSARMERRLARTLDTVDARGRVRHFEDGPPSS